MTFSLLQQSTRKERAYMLGYDRPIPFLSIALPNNILTINSICILMPFEFFLSM
jgi:hypothetical protein